MSGYSWVSGISIFCYLFLLLSFLTSKKKEGVIKSFEVLLVIMILWTGGSAGMRLCFWPSVNFWHHVSLLGMMLLCYGYYQFMLEFLAEESKFMRPFMFVFFIILYVFNCITNFFIPLPEVVTEGGQLQFLYHYDWKILLLIGPVKMPQIWFWVCWKRKLSESTTSAADGLKLGMRLQKRCSKQWASRFRSNISKCLNPCVRNISIILAPTWKNLMQSELVSKPDLWNRLRQITLLS